MKKTLGLKPRKLVYGLPNDVTQPFEYRTPIVSGIQMNPVFRWLLHLNKSLINSNWSRKCQTPLRSKHQDLRRTVDLNVDFGDNIYRLKNKQVQ